MTIPTATMRKAAKLAIAVVLCALAADIAILASGHAHAGVFVSLFAGGVCLISSTTYLRRTRGTP